MSLQGKLRRCICGFLRWFTRLFGCSCQDSGKRVEFNVGLVSTQKLK